MRLFVSQDALLHFLVAACDFNEPVSRRGEELLRKRCGVDAHKPAVDMEERALVPPPFLSGETARDACVSQAHANARCFL